MAGDWIVRTLKEREQMHARVGVRCTQRDHDDDEEQGGDEEVTFKTDNAILQRGGRIVEGATR